jgi:pyruvate/2-oxoglutarate dehydrogenase complex dihydrolipoamide dehydrogenase (E3) component
MVVDFPAAMAAHAAHPRRLSRVDSAGLVGAGIDLFFGTARFVGPDAVEVDGVTPAFQEGADRHRLAPLLPDIPGLTRPAS